MLNRHRTADAMEELVTTYFDLDNDAWLDALCRRPSGRNLDFGNVEDAAYWRQAQQLTTAASAVPASEPVEDANRKVC